MHHDITGIILCGGKSLRMGKNKAFLKLGEQYVIEVISGLMKKLFKRVILITNEPEDYKFLKLEILGDIHMEKGPLGGIHSGLIHSDTEKNFVISCDIPLITIEAIEFVVNYPSSKNIKVPFADGYVQQLSGIYSKSCLPLIEAIINERKDNLNNKKCSVLKLIEHAGCEIINIEKELPGYESYLFLNMNDISEYKKVKEICEEK